MIRLRCCLAIKNIFQYFLIVQSLWNQRVHFEPVWNQSSLGRGKRALPVLSIAMTCVCVYLILVSPLVPKIFIIYWTYNLTWANEMGIPQDRQLLRTSVYIIRRLAVKSFNNIVLWNYRANWKPILNGASMDNMC